MTREIMYPPAKCACEAALNPYVLNVMCPPILPARNLTESPYYLEFLDMTTEALAKRGARMLIID